MGTMEGYLLGQALAPDYDTGPAWEDRAMRERASALSWKAEAEKLSASLEREHKRFLVERRERQGYMRGWSLRGKILLESCGYTEERIDHEEDVLNAIDVHKNEIDNMIREKNSEINEESGF